MSLGALVVAYETAEVSVATWNQVTILAAREAITLEALRAYVEVTNRLAAAGPNCALSVVGERTRLPEADVQRAGVEALATCNAVCRARVVPGNGLWATAFKGMIRQTLTISATDPQATFSTLHEAVGWLAARMAMDMRFRLQLTTLAGTLVYGSPSWSRQSRAVGHLSNKRSDGTK